MSSMTYAEDEFEKARRRLRGMTGPRFWRALEELADDPAFRRDMSARMPQHDLGISIDRRRFLQLLAASIAFGGLAACRGPPAEQIVPWVIPPSGVVPGLSQFYATTLNYAGDTIGVLVESRSGRPTKVEGNPLHPASLGATGPLPQAAVLEVWDPDRSQTPRRGNTVSTWDVFAAEAAKWRERFATDGRELHVLSGRVRSPTLRRQRAELLARFPGSRWYEYESIANDNTMQGARLALGAPMHTQVHFEKADVIVALEADFLGTMASRVAYARAFSSRRHPTDDNGAGMSRLYVVEATPSLTGSMADHRWALPSAEIGLFLLEIARALGVAQLPASSPSGVSGRQLAAVIDDLRKKPGKSVIMIGESQPPEVHALAHLLNRHLGNVGTTVDYALSVDESSTTGSLGDLLDALRQSAVQTLLILDDNVAYTAPVDAALVRALEPVPNIVHWGLYRDETAQLAMWHLPAAHALEAWSDTQTDSGVVSLVQPLIQPLYDGRSVHELLALLMGTPPLDGASLVHATWQGSLGATNSNAWQEAVRTSIVETAAAPKAAVLPHAGCLTGWQPAPLSSTTLQLAFRPDPTVWDGAYANNGWLQELPKTLSQLTWGNAAFVSPLLASERGLANGDMVAMQCNGHRIEAPIWIMPGQASQTITVHFGYGRRGAGRVGDGLGFDAYAIRTMSALWFSDGLELTKLDRSVELATTQQHFRMEGTEPMHSLTLEQFLKGASTQDRMPPTLYPDAPANEYAWGMTIDLNTCIGCKGCTIACQSENNIPVVGADQVKRGREMHWIRVDRYYAGAVESPRTYHQPVPCMHCEHAPCEVVCPVGATVHDSEGLNVQVYNRCVGTRFCSNNCPYKVRRFNFLQYSDLTAETFKAQRNPEVTVRNRGVMEKCTYCIQRIETAHIAADKQQRTIADGEVVTACQAACPTQAIQFGNLHDPSSAVSREKASHRNYNLLNELNTRPRTSYLAHICNPHPDLAEDL